MVNGEWSMVNDESNTHVQPYFFLVALLPRCLYAFAFRLSAVFLVALLPYLCLVTLFRLRKPLIINERGIGECFQEFEQIEFIKIAKGDLVL
jgi:hypothetical protein